jgi:hypothetical protein
MLKKISLKFRFFALFTIIFIFAHLFTACDSPFSKSIDDYLNYWSNTVTIGRYDVISETTVLDGRRNLSAVEPIKINLIITNPNNYEIELELEGQPNFTIYQTDDETKSDVTINYSKKAELSSDGSIITLSAELPNDTERKKLMLEGMFKYFKQGDTGVYEEEVNYSYDFKQLSAPDNPKNLKNPEYSDTDSYHTLHFDMPDSSYKRNKDLTYRIDCFSSNTPGDFSFVATADVKADQAKKAGSKSNEFIYYFDEQEPSLQYDYVVTAISPEGVKSKVVSTSEALGLCYVTEPEILFGDNGELNNLKANREGDSKTYDVLEYTGDSFGINVIKTDLSSDLEVKVNGKTVSADATLEDGFNKITATASKNRARPVTVTKNIYVVKKLVEPKINSNASNEGTHNYQNINYDKMQYSYLKYENYTYSVDNSVNKDSEIKLTINNSDADLSGTLEDGYYTLEMNITKEYCRPLTVKKNYKVGIKRVKAKVKNDLHHWHTDGGADVDLIVELFIESSKSDKESIYYCNVEHIDNCHDYYSTTDVTKAVYLYEKTDNFYFYTSKAWDRDGKYQSNWDDLGTVSRGDSKATKTLKELKENPSIDTGDYKGSKDEHKSRYWVDVILSEEAAEPLIEFNPGLNGVRDVNGYECIEVADSSSKVSYKISPQDEATISGKIDDESFTGEKSGKLGVGTHKITVTSSKTGYTTCQVTKYIKVLTTFNEPNIYFYANNTNNRIDTSVSESSIDSYTTYDLNLTTSGTGNATLEVVAGTGETVTVEDGKNTLTAKNGRYELALGPHNLSITVSKAGYAPKVINKDIYILGILAEPTVIANNGSGETGSGNTEDDPKIWKFSYLSDPSLSVYIQPGNRGDNPNTVKVYLNATDGTEFSNPTSGFSVGYDSVKHLVIVQTRPYCKTKITHKYVKGIIKPIKLIYHNVRITGGLKGDARICVGGIKDIDGFDLLGEIKFDGTTIWGYGSSEYPIIHSNYWDHLNTDTDERSYERTLYSPDDKITLEMINMRRRKKEGNFGSHTLQKTLSAIKNVTVPTVRTYNSNTLDPPGGSNGWIFFTGRLTNGNCYMYMYLKFEVEEQN